MYYKLIHLVLHTMRSIRTILHILLVVRSMHSIVSVCVFRWWCGGIRFDFNCHAF